MGQMRSQYKKLLSRQMIKSNSFTNKRTMTIMSILAKLNELDRQGNNYSVTEHISYITEKCFKI